MNRQIKFRAFDADTKKMHTFPNQHEFGVCEGDWMIDFQGNVWERQSGTGGDFIPNNIILMQFTGLLDKNGKEIYEGDVVRFQWRKDLFIVAFFDGAFRGEFKDNSGFVIDARETEGCEIIGNIYENPELLKS